MKSVLALSILATPALPGGRAGAQASPRKTAQPTVNRVNYLNRKRIGARVLVSGGAYKELVNLDRFQTTSAPLTLESAVVSGSKALTGSLAAGGMLTHGSNDTSPACGFPTGRPNSPASVAPQNEIVFASGALHMQITAPAVTGRYGVRRQRPARE
jgi:hypothetical protein